ncbi:GntR family transcriptional regulator [Roseospira visakhapatnamensis]|uniref:DNA-binding GntR family transcriptional regulator n=1 Tax=Roseospira visakhapatnamensis TaxID=390880 RepID=A0A7W6RBV0_9PROT|nr:GntR family transcriptional regulator [Roseospira visakhapatnamensis]MBB4265660.1 DNA-binding GntR family transcriptional regulator [Roseospira visakhapatnamensis]
MSRPAGPLSAMSAGGGAGAGDGPRYPAIMRILVEEIGAGRYALGERLPTEHDLCQRFGASRHTVREALRHLKDMGLIARRQGSGSVIIAHYPEQRFVNSITSLDELVQYAETTWLDVLAVDKIVVDETLGTWLRATPGEPWLRLSALRRVAGVRDPFAYTEVFMPIAFEALVGEIGAEVSALYAMLERRFGVRVAKIHQSIEAVTADANVASRLDIVSGAPLLRIKRCYVAEDGTLIELAVNHHPADRFRYEMTLDRKPVGGALVNDIRDWPGPNEASATADRRGSPVHHATETNDDRDGHTPCAD